MLSYYNAMFVEDSATLLILSSSIFQTPFSTKESLDKSSDELLKPNLSPSERSSLFLVLFSPDRLDSNQFVCYSHHSHIIRRGDPPFQGDLQKEETTILSFSTV